MATKVASPYVNFLLELPIPAEMAPVKAAIAEAERVSQCNRCLHWAVYGNSVPSPTNNEACPYCGHTPFKVS